MEHRQRCRLAEGKRVFIEDSARFDGVRVVAVDDPPRASLQAGAAPSAWRHTGRGDRYVTVVIDLTPIRDKTGSARLLDMVEGRSKQVFKTWLAARNAARRDGVEPTAIAEAF